MGRKLLAVIYTLMLIAPTYAALEVCGGMTAFAMITVIMLLPCLAIDYVIATALLTLYRGCRKIWTNESSTSESDWATAVLGIIVGGLGIWFAQAFGRGRWEPDTRYLFSSISLIVSSLLIPITLRILDQRVEVTEYDDGEEFQ